MVHRCGNLFLELGRVHYKSGKVHATLNATMILHGSVSGDQNETINPDESTHDQNIKNEKSEEVREKKYYGGFRQPLLYSAIL